MRRRDLISLPILPFAMTAASTANAGGAGKNARAVAAARRVLPRLREEMAKKELAPGLPVHLRFYKEPSEMELWALPKDGTEWKLFRDWKIARWSGTLGPKTRLGDGQTPEGFYHTDLSSLNPQSQFHLSFNINYPNARDVAHGFTGNLIMVHGSNVSIGCYAMTNPAIEEIYTLVTMALGAGQARVPIHCFPFRMEEKRLAKAEKRADEAPHLAFWQELEPAWKIFEQTRRVPVVTVKDGRYVVTPV